MLNTTPEDLGTRVTTVRGGVAHAIRPPGSQAAKPSDHLIKVMLAPSPGVEVARGSDKVWSYNASAGMVILNPAGQEYTARWSSTKEYVEIAVKPEYLLDLAAQEFEMGNVELQSFRSGAVDPHALQLANLIKAELTTDQPPNELCADSLLTLFTVHVLRNYTSGRTAPVKVKGGLSPNSARRVREYMAENFARKLSVAELAAICNLSPNHFIHAFAKTFGERPHRYLINLRLDFAEKLLVESNMPYGPIAFMSGFSSQSHLTSTMSKYRQTTPAKIRQNK